MKELFKTLYGVGLNIGTAILGIEGAKCLDALLRFRRKIDLKDPKTLSDKICYLEINKNKYDLLIIQCSSKAEVRDYVRNAGLQDILVPCIGIYDRIEEIIYEKLPKRFVLKATHGCGMNIVCEDKMKLDWNQSVKVMRKWLEKPYYRACIEPHYLKIKPQIICEEYLDMPNGIIDYKIHCINGEPFFVLVCSEREKELKLNVYDLEWRPIQNALQGKMKNSREIERPFRLKEMIEISKRLSREFTFVRVDLYEINKRIFFGELTFTPATGVMPYYTDDFLLKYGKILNIDDTKV